MKLLASILLVMCSMTARADELPRARTGQLTEISRSEIELDDRRHIGFVGDPAVLDELASFKAGDRVLLYLGSVPSPRGRGRINKLLSIRRCEPVDADCAAVRAQDEADEQARDKRFAVLAEQSLRCEQAMKQSLAKDPRHVPPLESNVSRPDVTARYNALTGKQKKCANNIVADHREAVNQACELHHCGDHVAGGCAHITGYSGNSHLLEVAVAKCP